MSNTCVTYVKTSIHLTSYNGTCRFQHPLAFLLTGANDVQTTLPHSLYENQSRGCSAMVHPLDYCYYVCVSRIILRTLRHG